VRRLRIVVHDYAGHPFEVQLSRELARRGHEVLHLYCPAYNSGKGSLERQSGDSPSFKCTPVVLETFDKHAVVRRGFQEIRYGRSLGRCIAEAAPDVVISANAPLLSQWHAIHAARSAGAAFVFWLQDIISVAAQRVLDERVPFGRHAGRPLAALERRMLAQSDAVVAISEDFRELLARWGIPPDDVSVIENWAPLDELPMCSADNAWASEHGLTNKRVLLYSGTLGLKHNPDLLLALARRFRDERDVRVVIVSEGESAAALAVAKRVEQLNTLVLLPFQPYARLPEVMGAASVLVAILERDAGVYSVPSKVLSYLCAGRPVLASVPPENLAGQILQRSGGGIVVLPEDVDGFVDAAARLIADPVERDRAGRAARAYAVETFDVAPIASRFEVIVERARMRRMTQPRRSRAGRAGGVGVRGVPNGELIAEPTHQREPHRGT